MDAGGPVLEFVNDAALVRDPGALRDLLLRHGPAPPHDPTPEELERLSALREAMLQLADAVASGRAPAAGALADFNGFLGGVAVSEELAAADGGFAVVATPLAAGWETIVRELAGGFAALLAGGPARLKRCANEDCGRFFYDSSRSGNRRWHAESCGNLVRVRRFRAAR